MSEPVDIVKGGLTAAQFSLERNSKGIKCWVKVHPSVEELFREWARGSAGNVVESGRLWIVGQGKVPLRYWHLPEPLKTQKFTSGHYSVDIPGRDLFVPEAISGVTGGIYNLSMFRLVGASEGNGIEFHLNGIHSTSWIREMVRNIGDAGRRFYIDYLLPVNIAVQLHREDLPGEKPTTTTNFMETRLNAE